MPVIDKRLLEVRTLQVGREMFERVAGAAPSVFQAEWWEERLMQQCMRSEWLKVQSFRFVDALPTMSGPRDIARHLREYFANGNGANGNHLPTRREEADAALSELDPRGSDRIIGLISRAMDFSRLDSLPARVAAAVAWKGSTVMAHRFIAGSNTRQAEKAIRRMRGKRMAFTIDVLGEAAVSTPEALNYQQTYANLITELSRHAGDWRWINTELVAQQRR